MGAYVLYRANWQSRALEDPLIDRGVPYRLVGDRGFYGREEVKDALAYLRLATAGAEWSDDVGAAFERVGNKPSRGLGEKAMATILATARERNVNPVQAGLDPDDELPAAAKEGLAGLSDVFRAAAPEAEGAKFQHLREILEGVGYLESWRSSDDANAERRLENLEEVCRAVEEAVDPRIVLDRAEKGGTETSGATVVLMTLHAAKGLEADFVVLAGWGEGLFPTQRAADAADAGNMDAEEEERRLAYVGITRARRHLAVTYVGKASRFLEEIPRHLTVRRRWRCPGETVPPPTEKALSYCRDILRGLSLEEPDGLASNADLVSETIDLHAATWNEKRRKMR